MKIYKIPCTWMCCGAMNIQAESLEDAIQLTRERGELPQGSYIDDSFEIDQEGLELMLEKDGTYL